jgi:transketolase
MPELWGGSADLAGSNNTTMRGVKSFLPPEQSSHDFVGDYTGRTLHFGIREHAMGNIVNAITISGLTRAYGGTFLVFADYMRGAVRLAAIQRVGSIFLWSHDSIGVGEDGPTHQPIEHLASLRAVPGLDVIRPADANETAQAWAQALAHTDRPSAIILSRQDLLTVDRTQPGIAPATELARGGYTLVDADGELKVVLIATGSEVEVALAARDVLQAEGVGTRVVSMPCTEWFDAQDAAYKADVLPEGVAKVAVEAGVPMGWREYVGDAGEIVAIDHFGESASGNLLFAKYGFTARSVADRARIALRHSSDRHAGIA